MALLVALTTHHGTCPAGLDAQAVGHARARIRDLANIHHACLAPAAYSWSGRQSPEEELVEHHR